MGISFSDASLIITLSTIKLQHHDLRIESH